MAKDKRKAQTQIMKPKIEVTKYTVHLEGGRQAYLGEGVPEKQAEKLSDGRVQSSYIREVE